MPTMTDSCVWYATCDFCVISVLYLYYCEILEAVLGTPGHRAEISALPTVSLWLCHGKEETTQRKQAPAGWPSQVSCGCQMTGCSCQRRPQGRPLPIPTQTRNKPPLELIKLWPEHHDITWGLGVCLAAAGGWVPVLEVGRGW